ncbi:MAG: hypothetical protein ACE5HL_08220, partial [Terriglobia bacterium]
SPFRVALPTALQVASPCSVPPFCTLITPGWELEKSLTTVTSPSWPVFQMPMTVRGLEVC